MSRPGLDPDEEIDQHIPLVTPSIGVSNYNRTNENGDLLIYLNQIISRATDPLCTTSSEYTITEYIASGVCGSVYKATRKGSDQIFTIKIIKRMRFCSYYPSREKQVLETVRIFFILAILSFSLSIPYSQIVEADPDDQKHLLRLEESFIFLEHICIVTEFIPVSLSTFISNSSETGLSLPTIQTVRFCLPNSLFVSFHLRSYDSS